MKYKKRETIPFENIFPRKNAGYSNFWNYTLLSSSFEPQQNTPPPQRLIAGQGETNTPLSPKP